MTTNKLAFDLFNLLQPENKREARVRILLPAENSKYYLQKTRTPNKYRVPGGKVEPGEDLHQAAIRELNEEFGIDPNHTKKHLRYLGPDHRKEYKHEHYFILDRHPVTNKKYIASNDPKEIVDMDAVIPSIENYFGPDLDIMLKHRKTAAFNLLNLIQGNNDVSDKSTGNSVIGQANPNPHDVLKEKELGPYFRVMAIRNGQLRTPEGVIDEIDPERKDPRRVSKPDESWYQGVRSFPGAEYYWTTPGLKKYMDSGLFDYHRALTDADLAILISKKINNPSWKSEHRYIVKPNTITPDDTYFIDRNRTTPIKAEDLIERYSDHPKPQYEFYKRSGFNTRLPLPRPRLPLPKPVLPEPAIPKISPSVIEGLENAGRELPKSIPKELKPILEAPRPEISVPKELQPILSEIPKPEAPKPGWMGEQLRYAAGMEPGDKFWGFNKKTLDPNKEYKVPGHKAFAQAKQWLANKIPTPVSATKNLIFSPRYPVVEPALNRFGYGSQYLPTAARLTATAGGVGGTAFGAYKSLYRYPEVVAQDLANQDIIPQDEVKRIGGNLAGTNAVRAGWDLYNPYGDNKDPFSQMHRDIIRKSLVPSLRYDVGQFRKQNPWPMLGLDVAKSFTPFGLASTVASRLGTTDTNPRMDQIMRDSILKYGPEITKNPEQAWNSPMRKVYTDKVFDDKTVSNPEFRKNISDNVNDYLNNIGIRYGIKPGPDYLNKNPYGPVKKVKEQTYNNLPELRKQILNRGDKITQTLGKATSNPLVNSYANDALYDAVNERLPQRTSEWDQAIKDRDDFWDKNRKTLLDPSNTAWAKAETSEKILKLWNATPLEYGKAQNEYSALHAKERQARENAKRK